MSGEKRWWRGWLDPWDIDSWLQLILSLLMVAVVVVVAWKLCR